MSDRYRLRVIAVTARQWTGLNDTELTMFAETRFMTVPAEERDDDPYETAALLESYHDSWLGLRPGDWVVRDEQGAFSRVRGEAFPKTFEPVADEEQQP